jgi:hypothetical protein
MPVSRRKPRATVVSVSREMSRSEFEMSRLWGQKDGDIGGGHGGTSPFRGDVPRHVPVCPGTNVPVECPGVESGAGSPKGLRQLMPVTAEIVDELRQWLGREFVDEQIRQGKRGRPTFWARETGPDGVVREFGSRPAGCGDGA